MVRQGAAELLPAWLRAVAGSKPKEFVGFAMGINEGYQVVKDAHTSGAMVSPSP